MPSYNQMILFSISKNFRIGGEGGVGGFDAGYPHTCTHLEDIHEMTT